MAEGEEGELGIGEEGELGIGSLSESSGTIRGFSCMILGGM
jgi:hypothetical protein